MANSAISTILPYIKDSIKESGTGRDAELIRTLNKINRRAITPTLVRFRSDYGLTEWYTTETSAYVRTISQPTSFLAFYELYCIDTYHTGTVGSSGETSTITLDSDASSSDDTYNGMLLRILSGTGDNQQSAITDYDGTTQVATLASAFGTGTGASDTFAIFRYPSKGNRLRRRDLDWINCNRTGDGMPDSYAINSSNIELGYIPDDTYILWGWYYTYPTRLTATTDTLPYDPVFDEILIEYATMLALNRDEYSVQFEASVFNQVEEDMALILNERKAEVTNLELIGTEDS